MSKQKWFICIPSIRNRNAFSLTAYILNCFVLWNFLSDKITLLVYYHLSILIGVSQKEAPPATLSLILKLIDFIWVLRTFLKGDEKIWLKIKVSSSCSHIHSFTVPGDKEQLLHSTKMTSYSFCYQITRNSNTASQPSVVLLIFTLTFSFMVHLVTADARYLPGAWNTPSKNPWGVSPWGVPLKAKKPFQKKKSVSVQLNSAETPEVFHRANIAYYRKKSQYVQKSCAGMDAVPPRILTNMPHLLHGVINKKEGTSLVQDAHGQNGLRWDLGHHSSTSAQFNIFVSSSPLTRWAEPCHFKMFCLVLTMAIVWTSMLLTCALKEQLNTERDFG